MYASTVFLAARYVVQRYAQSGFWQKKGKHELNFGFCSNSSRSICLPQTLFSVNSGIKSCKLTTPFASAFIDLMSFRLSFLQKRRIKEGEKVRRLFAFLDVRNSY